MKKKIRCSLCDQFVDVYTTDYKNNLFIDGKNYTILCFTCCFVPKTIEQIYNSKGLIKEEIQIPYSCENLNSPKDVYNQGSAESLKQAKKSVESVQKSCDSCKNKNIKKINPSWKVL